MEAKRELAAMRRAIISNSTVEGKDNDIEALPFHPPMFCLAAVGIPPSSAVYLESF
jgi:hypothetical protein